ncbi:MAG: hypothetical protein AAFR61_04385 [Bacteroidota bacterium]
MRPGLYEVILILLALAFLVGPVLKRRGEAQKKKRFFGFGKKKSSYRPPRNARSVEFEELDED